MKSVKKTFAVMNLLIQTVQVTVSKIPENAPNSLYIIHLKKKKGIKMNMYAL